MAKKDKKAQVTASSDRQKKTTVRYYQVVASAFNCFTATFYIINYFLEMAVSSVLVRCMCHVQETRSEAICSCGSTGKGEFFWTGASLSCFVCSIVQQFVISTSCC